MTTPSEALKKCTKCGEAQPEFEYYVRTDGRLQSQCKTCFKTRVKARRYGSDRARVLKMDRASMREYRKRVRQEVFAAYGGYRCVCCGETEPTFLTLDHINNDGGEFRKKELGKRTHSGYHTYRWLLRNGCPPVVQVLCMNCQHGKLMNKGVCPHQRTCNDYPAREYGQAAGSAVPLI